VNWNEMQRYQGAVNAHAVYRAPVLGFLGVLSVLGIVSLDGAQLPGLETFRSEDEHKAHLADVEARITEINNEFMGKALDDAARTEWAALTQRRIDSNAVITELAARRAEVEKIAADDAPGRTERAGGPIAMPSVPRTRVPDDIFDLAAYRQTSRNERDEVSLIAEGVKRVIDTISPAHEKADEAKAREHITKLLVKGGDKHGVFGKYLIALSSPRYRDAFAKAVSQKPLSPTEQELLAGGQAVQEMLALSTGTPSDGGYAVPVALDPTLIPTSDGVINPLRDMARVISITSNRWQGVTASAVTIGYDGEKDATQAQDGPVLGAPTLWPVRLTGLIRFSREIEGDAPRLLAELAQLYQDAKDELEAEKFAFGGGPGGGPGGKDEPAGLISSLPNSSKIGTAGGSGTFSAPDVYAVKNQTPPRWRSKGQYLAESAIYDEVRQFDTDGGSNMWVQLADPNPPTLIGYRARELSTMDAEIVDGNEILLFGDFKQFAIVDRVGMSIETIPHLFDGDGNPTGERGLYLYGRNTSGVLVPKAFRLLVVGAVGSGS
jgi:HK97 family phage major capsid protein